MVPAPVSAAVVQAGVPHGAREGGWLPDAVYTGGKFETGLAFFADAMGRITRFSREPADLAAARRLQGQVALPGLVNTHSHALHRLLRGRIGRGAGGGATAWRGQEAAAWGQVSLRCNGEEVCDAARMAFLEMLLSGVTCVGEFHCLHHQADGTPWPDPNFLAKEVIRAAHEVGIRLALLKVAQLRAGFGTGSGTGAGRSRSGGVEEWIRDLESLRTAVEREYAADEVWLGAAPDSLAEVPLDAMKAIAAYARTQRLRLHVHAALTPEENAACVAEYGRPPVALLAEHGLVDKRFTAVGAIHLSAEEVKLVGTARAATCACPGSELRLGLGIAPVTSLLAAGAGVALGSDTNGRIDLLEEARLLEHRLRADPAGPGSLGADWASVALHAATVSGARSLGAPGGALEVGRPADFFTVSLFDPAVAGCGTEALPAAILEALDRRSIRDVWIGARQRIAAGRHVNHGMIVGRFVDTQQRLWPA